VTSGHGRRGPAAVAYGSLWPTSTTYWRRGRWVSLFLAGGTKVARPIRSNSRAIRRW